jgi:hypothetical protein
MKEVMELVGGLVILFGGLGALGVQGMQGLHKTQTAVAVGQVKKANQASVQAVEENKTVEDNKTVGGRAEREEYYDYKEEGELEMWEKMKAHYKDYAYEDVAGGDGNEQSN